MSGDPTKQAGILEQHGIAYQMLGEHDDGWEGVGTVCTFAVDRPGVVAGSAVWAIDGNRIEVEVLAGHRAVSRSKPTLWAGRFEVIGPAPDVAEHPSARPIDLADFQDLDSWTESEMETGR